MSLHQVSEFDSNLAAQTRARRERLGFRRIVTPLTAPVVVAPPPKPAPRPSPARIESAAQFYEAGWRAIYALEKYEPHTATCDQIIRTVAHFYGITNTEIRNHRHSAYVVKPRQIAYYLCSEITGGSLPEIGRHMGKDHTSVLHGIRRIRGRLPFEPELSSEVDQLISVLRPVSSEEQSNAENNRADRI